MATPVSSRTASIAHAHYSIEHNRINRIEEAGRERSGRRKKREEKEAGGERSGTRKKRDEKEASDRTHKILKQLDRG
jgi:hypothetical protein